MDPEIGKRFEVSGRLQISDVGHALPPRDLYELIVQHEAPPLYRLLLLGLESDDRRVRVSTMTYIGYSFRNDFIDSVIPRLKDPDAEMRCAAVRSVGQMISGPTIPYP